MKGQSVSRLMWIAQAVLAALLLVAPASAGPPYVTDDAAPPTPGVLETIVFA